MFVEIRELADIMGQLHAMDARDSFADQYGNNEITHVDLEGNVKLFKNTEIVVVRVD